MKRTGPKINQTRKERKRVFRGFDETDKAVQFQLKLLANWEIASEALHFLQDKGKVCSPFEDRTQPTHCLAIYSPNVYQNIIDALDSPVLSITPIELET